MKKTQLVTIIIFGAIIIAFLFINIKSKIECQQIKGQCKDKLDGSACNFGLWCDEKDRICGGKDCVSLTGGVCLNEKCVRSMER